MTNQVFYASIPEPTEFRKDVLLTQKAIIDSLRKHEHIKKLRAEKEMRIGELKKMLAQLKLISGKMKSALPAQAMKRKETVKSAGKHTRKETVQKQSKMDILEDELSKIESKLSSLE